MMKLIYGLLTILFCSGLNIVNAQNNAPIAAADTDSTVEGVALTISVLSNDSDPDGDNFFLTIAGSFPGGSDNLSTQGGTFSIEDNGTPADSTDDYIDYTPPGSFVGTDTFYYVITDPAGDKDTALVAVKVKPGNQRPDLGDDVAVAFEDSLVVIDVKANDSDPDGDPFFTIIVSNGPSDGSTLILGSDSIRYIPDPDFFGLDSFDYQSIDIKGGLDTAKVVVTVLNTPDKPDAIDDVHSTPEDILAAVDVLDNDIDIDLSSLFIARAGSFPGSNDSLSTRGGSAIPHDNGTPADSTDDFVAYLPTLDYTGMDTFYYVIIDPAGLMDTAEVIMTVNPVNDPPQAVDDLITSPEDVTVVIDVRANDSDPENDPLTTASIVLAPVHGSANILNSDSIQYIPDLNFFGVDSLRYRINDTVPGFDTAVVVITVDPVDDPPVAIDDTTATTEDIGLPVDVLINDFHVDNDNSLISHAGSTPGANDLFSARGGTLVINDNGSPADSTDDFIDYTPGLNYFGNDTFYYALTDPQGLMDTARMLITVTPVNDPPLANNDTVQTPEDQTLLIDVQGNDLDPENDTLSTVLIIESPVNGGAAILNNDSIQYIPNPNFFGSDSLQYRLSDNKGGLDSAWVLITVTSVNDRPVAMPDTVATLEDILVNIMALINDSDVDGDNFLITAAGSDPGSNDLASRQGGACLIDDNGTPADSTDDFITFTPFLNYAGQDTFYYVITDPFSDRDTAHILINITPVNDPPNAVDDVAAGPEDNTLIIDVQANDFDPEGDTLTTVSIITPPKHGTPSILDADSIQYIPDPHFHGNDTLEYRLGDNQAGFDTAQVVIVITSVNDAPEANEDLGSTPEDSLLTVTVLDNDLDVDGDNFLIIRAGDQPGANNLISVENGSLVIDDNATPADSTDDFIDYTPFLNFSGLDTFYYVVIDPFGARDTGRVVIDVAGVNDPPFAIADLDTVDEDGMVVIDVLANDSDQENDPLSTTGITTPPVHGAAIILNNDSIQYTPDPNYFGPDSLAYEISDTADGLDTATVYITVLPTNDPPDAVPDNGATSEDITLAVDVLTNDNDIDGDPVLLYTAGSTPGSTDLASSRGGTLSLNDNGTPADSTDDHINYTPLLNYTGLDTFYYQIKDPSGLFDTAMVEITITPINDPPVANVDSVTVLEDIALIVDVQANDTDVEGDALTTITLPVLPVHGNAIIQNSDSVLYDPDNHYFGTDSFAYRISDGNGGFDNGWVYLNVMPVDDLPVAVNDTVTGSEDSPLQIAVMGNDIDVDLEGIRITAVGSSPGSADGLSASGATVAIDDNGTPVDPTDDLIVYTPVLNYFGPDTFYYELKDVPDNADTAMVIIDILPVNDPPVAIRDTAMTDEEFDVVVRVQLNDTDVENDPLTTSAIVDVPVNGSVNILNGDSINYQPNLHFFGTDSFSYRLADQPGGSDTGVVVILVNNIQDPPEANLDFGTVDPGDSVVVMVQFNDSDPDGDTLTTNIIVPPDSGTAVILDGDSIRYKPNITFLSGLDTIVYEVCDTAGLCDTAMLVIVVPNSNIAPLALDDPASLPEDDSIVVRVQANDLDPNLDPMTTSIVSGPGHGTGVVINGDSIQYKPGPDYFGPDTIAYAVCDTGSPALCDTANILINVTPVNDAPVALNDNVTTPEDTAIAIPLSITDIEGDGLSIVILSGPDQGMAALNNDTIVYTPDPDYFGIDTIHFQVCDHGIPSRCDTARIVINVSPVNDRPVAVDDHVTIAEDMPVVVDVQGNDGDADPDVLTTTIISLPDSGIAGVLNGDSISYSPNNHFNGSDTIVYVVDDGNGGRDTAVLYITVTPVPDRPVALDDNSSTNPLTPVVVDVQFNDSDPDGDAFTTTIAVAPTLGNVLILDGDSIRYTPLLGVLNGLDSFYYQICDGLGLCDTALVEITIPEINLPPLAGNDPVSVDEDQSLVVDVQDNDFDQNGDSIATAIVSGPTHGTAFVVNNDSIDYEPDPNYFGPDTIVYEVCDTGALCDTALVIITVNPVNDRPIAADDNAITPENTQVATNVLSNDLDQENALDPNNVQLIAGPQNGSAFYTAATTSISYTPDPAFFGIDTVAYLVCDTGDPVLCDTGSYIIQVTFVNDPPVALADTNITDEDVPVTVAVLANDTDADNNIDPATVNLLSTPVHGSAVVNTGVIDYTPDQHYNGIDSLVYSVCDLGNPVFCDTAKVILIMLPVNDPPVAVTDSDTTPFNTAVTLDLIANDSDPENGLDAGSIVILQEPANGAYVFDSLNSTVLYTPGSSFFGNDTMQYSICDAGNPVLCDSALILVNVEIPNHPPVANDDSATTDQETAVTFEPLDNDTDPDDNIDIGSLVILSGPGHGTALVNLADGSITYTPNNGFFGLDTLTYMICDQGEPVYCDTAMIIIRILADLPVPYTGFSPNGDGVNDTWTINGIAEFPDNEVLIFNRWGSQVWSVTGYNNKDKAWLGENMNGKDLPDGIAYYYIVKLNSTQKPNKGETVLKGSVYLYR